MTNNGGSKIIPEAADRVLPEATPETTPEAVSDTAPEMSADMDDGTSAGMDRRPRDIETREFGERPQSWRPPELLPTPDPKPGYDFRWIRSTMLGSIDNLNVSSKFREGWVPVLASEFPELCISTDEDSRFPENIEIGGLILCQIPSSMMRQRREHYDQLARNQMESVQNNFLREENPRMPMLQPELRSTTS